jgi:hypothetical protein
MNLTLPIRVCALVALLATPALSGDAVLPIEDLTYGVARPPRPEMSPWPTPSGGFGFGFGFREEDPDTFASPFRTTLAEQGQPLVDGADFAHMLAALAGTKDFRLSADYSSLLVPEASLEAVRTALRRMRASRPPFVDLGYSIEVKEGEAWKTIAAVREGVLAGDLATFLDGSDVSYLSDFDVEIAQASDFCDPILTVLQAGAFASLRVLPVPGTKTAVVRANVVVARARPGEPMRPEYIDMSDIDRLIATIERASVTLCVLSGQRSECRWTGRDGRALRLALTATWRETPGEAGEGAVLWSPLLSHGVEESVHVPPRMRSAGWAIDERMPMFGRSWRLPAPSVEGDKDALVAPADPGLIVFRGPGAAASRDGLVARLAAANRQAEIEYATWDLPSGAAVPEGDEVPAGAREIARAAAQVRVGANVLFSAGEAYPFLQDYDVEVAQASSIMDPIVQILLLGTYSNVRVCAGPDGRPAFVDLDLSLARLEGMERVSIPRLLRLDPSQVLDLQLPIQPGGGGGTATGIVAGSGKGRVLRTSYAVEKPTVRQVRVAARLPLDEAGTAVLRRALPGYLGEGREILVTIRVK